jgi:hypothetical protein
MGIRFRFRSFGNRSIFNFRFVCVILTSGNGKRLSNIAPRAFYIHES